jgi:hypothetical protein
MKSFAYYCQVKEDGICETVVVPLTGEMRNAYQILIRILQGKGQIGGHKDRWEKYNKIVLVEQG